MKQNPDPVSVWTFGYGFSFSWWMDLDSMTTLRYLVLYWPTYISNSGSTFWIKSYKSYKQLYIKKTAFLSQFATRFKYFDPYITKFIKLVYLTLAGRHFFLRTIRTEGERVGGGVDSVHSQPNIIKNSNKSYYMGSLRCA